MPYKIQKRAEQYCVVNKVSGESKGCSRTLEEAQKHMAALYANEPKTETPSAADQERMHAAMRHASATSTAGYKARTEIFEGREHLVVPVVMLVQGVVHAINAETPELVTAQEFSKQPNGWNGRPLFHGHPMRNGKPVSGNIPEVLMKDKIGMVFNAKAGSEKLTSEAWIDKVAAKDRAPELLDRVMKGEPIEISVGAFVDTVNEAGTYGDRDYKAVWKDIVPDHLALLPAGDEGACSMEMGCGIRAAEHANQYTGAAAKAKQATEHAAKAGAGQTAMRAHLDAANAHQAAAMAASSAGKSAEFESHMEKSMEHTRQAMSNGMRAGAHANQYTASGLSGTKLEHVKEGSVTGAGYDDSKPGKMSISISVDHQPHGEEDKRVEPGTTHSYQREKTGGDWKHTGGFGTARYGYSEQNRGTGRTQAAGGKVDKPLADKLNKIADHVLHKGLPYGRVKTLEQARDERGQFAGDSGAASKAAAAATTTARASGTAKDHQKAAAAHGHAAIAHMRAGDMTRGASAKDSAEHMSKFMEHMAQSLEHANLAGSAVESVGEAARKNREIAESKQKIASAAEGSVAKHMYAEWLEQSDDLDGFLRTLRDIPQAKRDEMPKENFAGPNESFPIEQGVDVENASRAIGRAKGNRGAIKSKIIAIAYRMGLEDHLPEDWKKKKDQKNASAFRKMLSAAAALFRANQTTEEMSDKDLRAKLQEALEEVEDCLMGVEAFAPVNDPSHVIYRVYEMPDDPSDTKGYYAMPMETCLYERAFELSAEGVVTLSDTRVEVVPVTAYEPANGAKPEQDEEDLRAASAHKCSCSSSAAQGKPGATSNQPCGCGPKTAEKQTMKTREQRIAKLMDCERNPIKDKSVLESLSDAQLKTLRKYTKGMLGAEAATQFKACATKKEAEAVISKMAEAHNALHGYAGQLAAKAAAQNPPVPAAGQDDSAKGGSTQTVDQAGKTGGSAAPKAAEAKPTFAELLEAADDDTKAAIKAATASATARKQAAIKSLKSNPRNKFSDEQLAAMPIEQLDALVALAGHDVRDYSGAGAVKVYEGEGKGNVPAPTDLGEAIRAARSKK